jgi:predicted ABC-class ATPase
VAQHLLALSLQGRGGSDLERVAVEDEVRGRLDDDVTVALDLDDLVDRVDDDLVLLRLVDDRDLLGAFLVVEDDAMTRARLDQLGVVLPRGVDLDGLLLLAP